MLFMDLFSRKIIGWQVYDDVATIAAMRHKNRIPQRSGFTKQVSL